MLSYIGQVITSIPGGLLVLEAMPFISIALVLFALYIFIQHYQVFTRKRLDGEIVKSELEADFNGGMNKSSMFIYRANLDFKFEYEGKTYHTSKTSSFQFKSAFDPMAGEKVRRFPVGGAVSVYLNPKKPEASIVENMFPYNIYLIGMVALLSICSTMLWFIQSIKTTFS